MLDKEMKAQIAEYDGRDELKKPDLTVWQAITMSVVAILAVAVGTIYGTILF